MSTTKKRQRTSVSPHGSLGQVAEEHLGKRPVTNSSMVLSDIQCDGSSDTIDNIIMSIPVDDFDKESIAGGESGLVEFGTDNCI